MASKELHSLDPCDRAILLNKITRFFSASWYIAQNPSKKKRLTTAVKYIYNISMDNPQGDYMNIDKKKSEKKIKSYMVKIDADLLDKAQKKARENDRFLSQEIRRFVKEFVETNKLFY